MNTFWGTFRSYLFAVIFIVLGVGAFSYLSLARVKNVGVPEAVDITYGTGFDMADLQPGMRIVVKVNNYAGYDYFYSNNMKDTKGRKVYFSYDTPIATKEKDPLILTFMPEERDYSKWDSLSASSAMKKSGNNTLVFTGYAVKMTKDQFKDVRNVYLVSGVDDADELEKAIVPYYFVNNLEQSNNDKTIFKIASLAAAALGLIMLVGSVIGTIINRY